MTHRNTGSATLDANPPRADEERSGTILLGAPSGARSTKGVHGYDRQVEAETGEVQLADANRDRLESLGTLAAGVAHAINNPLTYTLVNVEHVLRRIRAASASASPHDLLSDEASGGLLALAHSLSQAMDGAQTIRRVVRDLLTFSQGQLDSQGLVDVRGIVESAAQMAWHELRHRARVSKVLAEVPPVHGSEAGLAQVFLNLIVNAAQSISEGHADDNEIRIATRKNDRGDAVVEISDTGAGIPDEHLAHVFEPFFSARRGGTGLGLSIAHGTVKSLGGDIQVTSGPGRGTTFEVVLPAAKGWRAGSSGGLPSAPIVARRVLVVDDEPLVGEALARSLAEDNEVDVLTDAREALEWIVEGRPYDVVLCDLMMPTMTGMDLYAEVVRRVPHAARKLVFMTAGAFTPRARAFLQTITNPWLEKPIDMGRLRSIIGRA